VNRATKSYLKNRILIQGDSFFYFFGTMSEIIRQMIDRPFAKEPGNDTLHRLRRTIRTT